MRSLHNVLVPVDEITCPAKIVVRRLEIKACAIAVSDTAFGHFYAPVDQDIFSFQPVYRVLGDREIVSTCSLTRSQPFVSGLMSYSTRIRQCDQFPSRFILDYVA